MTDFMERRKQQLRSEHLAHIIDRIFPTDTAEGRAIVDTYKQNPLLNLLLSQGGKKNVFTERVATRTQQSARVLPFP
jgi:hypothetical protein